MIKKEKTRKRKFFFLWGILICVMIWKVIIPYSKVEHLTAKYGEEFKDLHRMSGFIQEIEYFKVFSYNETIAHVYYVEKGHSTRNYFIFQKNGLEWALESWECLWSSSGSADRNIWPFYP